jgi:hypothetical protein
MTDCPHCRKPIDPLATRCPYCRSEIQLSPVQPAATTFYSAVMAPALGAGLMSFFFWMLSPFSGFALHAVFGGATDLTLRGYMVGFDAFLAIALVAMSLAALCGWLRYVRDSLLLSLLSFLTPFMAPPLLIVVTQIADIARSI